jgi:ligand-binding sensor domain-containing protein
MKLIISISPRLSAKHRTGSALAAMFFVAAAATNAGAAGASAATPAKSALAPWHVGPVPQVRAICHAGDSLWVGTNVGVFIADIRDPSHRVLVSAGPLLPSSSVRAISARGDSVWVATDAGVSIFSGGRAGVMSARGRQRSRGAIPLRNVQNIAFGSRGEVLLATRSGGVGVLDGAHSHAITTRDSLIDQNVYDILDRSGRPRLYACAAGVCAQVDDTTIVSFQAGAGFPRGEARQLAGDERAAYVRIARRGIFRFDGRHAQALDAPGIPLRDAGSISLGADHALWVAGPGFVAVMRAGKWKKLQAPALDWRVIVADGAGAFAGASDGTVIALNRGADFKLSLGDGLAGPSVVSIAPDGRGSAWFVCGGHVMSANAAARTVSVEKSPLDAEAVEFSPAGTVFAAGRWTVSRRDASGWTDVTPRLIDNDPAFASVFVDDQNMVWVGARSGALYRYDGEVWLRYEQPRFAAESVRDARSYPGSDWARVGSAPMIGHDGCWTRFADWDSSAVMVDMARSPGGDWIAASRDRLFRYDAKRAAWQPLGPQGSTSKAPWDTPAPITAIAFDPAGRLFIGTDDGFGVLVQGRLHWWSASDGTGGERVNDLAADAKTLWVGYADDGFSAFSLDDLR